MHENTFPLILFSAFQYTVKLHSKKHILKIVILSTAHNHHNPIQYGCMIVSKYSEWLHVVDISRFPLHISGRNNMHHFTHLQPLNKLTLSQQRQLSEQLRIHLPIAPQSSLIFPISSPIFNFPHSCLILFHFIPFPQLL